MPNRGIIFTMVLFLIPNISPAQEIIQAPAAIQIASTVSDGKYTLEEIVSIARKNRFRIVVPADRDYMKWEYGLWPLKNIIKKKMEENSVFRYGVKRYLKKIKHVQDANPDILLVPGIESAPFYYWQGDLFTNSLKLKDWHKHLLAIGMYNEKDYLNLPVVGNKRGLSLPFEFKDLVLLWPIALIAAGICLSKKRRFSYTDSLGNRLGPYSKVWRNIGFALILVGILFFLNNFPFRDIRFNQYKGDVGILPYQNFIDYVNKHSGLSFWAHPEAKNCSEIEAVSVETERHEYDLLRTSNYTGFLVFYEGYSKTGCIGGIWDEILNQYCTGKREKPAWAIAGLSFDSNGDLNYYIKDLRTVILMTAFNTQEALNALRSGRMYVLSGKESSNFMLDNFFLKDESNGIKKMMGEELQTNDNPTIEIAGRFLDGHDRKVKIKLIKNGKLLRSFDEACPFSISFCDEEKTAQKRGYYRLEIFADGLHGITNPIFLFKNKS